LKDETDVDSPQESVNEWQDSLESTGGMLVNTKCSYAVVTHKLKNNRWETSTKINERIKIYIKDENGVESPITQYSPTQGELALGIKFLPLGEMKDEVAHLKEKTMTWAEKMRVGFLKHHEVWLCLNATKMRTIDYALPATTMTKKELDDIIRPIVNIALSKSGICKKMSRVVVFTPIKFQGLGLKHPYDTQGINKIESLLNTNETVTKKLLEATWQRTMQESGYGFNYLEKDGSEIHSNLKQGWMASMWQYLTFNTIWLRRIATTGQLKERFDWDSFIMEDMCKSQQWSTEEKKKFNYCRLYLRVELLSDVMTADGKAIRRHIWKGIVDHTHEKFTQLFYTQHRPSKTLWSTWRKMLKVTYQCKENGEFNLTKPAIETTIDWV
jgi:hypothetical protein